MGYPMGDARPLLDHKDEDDRDPKEDLRWSDLFLDEGHEEEEEDRHKEETKEEVEKRETNKEAYEEGDDI